jgi:hypothetical protein
MDGRTRPEHAEAHGQRRLFGEDFVVGGYHCRYPGDPNLPVHLRVNERCATVSYEPETPPPARSTRVEPVG